MLKSLQNGIQYTWCLFVVFLFIENLMFAEESQKTVSVKLKCLLISLEDYRKAPLDYAKNDITELSTILQLRYGAQSECFIDTPQEIANTGTDDRSAIKNVFENKIKLWTQSLDSDDIAILYVAGHGILNDKKELYLP